MRTPLKSIAKAALTRQLSILFILLIVAIGVQTITSCFGGSDDPPNGGGGGEPSSSSSAASSIGTINGPSVAYQGETYKTVVIGTQTWMARNLNYNASGSKCYGNSDANCTTYGKLYDWATAMALPSSCNSSSCASQIQPKHRGICPENWHIPSDAEWGALMQFVNPNCSATGECANAGKYLKATNGWNSYRGQSGNGTDAFGFSALPGGGGSLSNGGPDNFFEVGNIGMWWSSSETNGDDAYNLGMEYDDEYAWWVSNGKSFLFSVRCLQDNSGGGGGEPSSSSYRSSSSSNGGSSPSNGNNSSSSGTGNGGGGNVVYGTPVSYEGETYKTVVIGTQTWMARNLNYNASGSKCYGNSDANCATYGRLYDWATARTVCPTGWHLPSDAEWDALMTAVGGEETAGTKLKATSGWEQNGNGTDDYGFSALPGGSGKPSGNFSNVGYGGIWWSATESDASDAHSRYMRYHTADVGRDILGKSYFFSVRCVLD